MTYDINGKTAFVTGANRGIGLAITESLIKHGAKRVYTAVRNIATVEPLKKKYGEKIVPIHLDLQQPKSIIAAARKAQDVTLVVNNAGVFSAATALDNNVVEDLKFEMENNVYGLLTPLLQY